MTRSALWLTPFMRRVLLVLVEVEQGFRVHELAAVLWPADPTGRSKVGPLLVCLRRLLGAGLVRRATKRRDADLSTRWSATPKALRYVERATT